MISGAPHQPTTRATAVRASTPCRSRTEFKHQAAFFFPRPTAPLVASSVRPRTRPTKTAWNPSQQSHVATPATTRPRPQGARWAHLRECGDMREHLRRAVLQLINAVVQLEQAHPRLLVRVRLPRPQSRLPPAQVSTRDLTPGTTSEPRPKVKPPPTGQDEGLHTGPPR